MTRSVLIQDSNNASKLELKCFILRSDYWEIFTRHRIFVFNGLSHGGKEHPFSPPPQLDFSIFFSKCFGCSWDFADRLPNLEYTFSELEVLMTSRQPAHRDPWFLQISENIVQIDVFWTSDHPDFWVNLPYENFSFEARSKTRRTFKNCRLGLVRPFLCL